MYTMLATLVVLMVSALPSGRLTDKCWLAPPAFIQDTSPGWECLELVPTGISGVGDADHRSGLPVSHVYLHVTLQP